MTLARCGRSDGCRPPPPWGARTAPRARRRRCRGLLTAPTADGTHQAGAGHDALAMGRQCGCGDTRRCREHRGGAHPRRGFRSGRTVVRRWSCSLGNAKRAEFPRGALSRDAFQGFRPDLLHCEPRPSPCDWPRRTCQASSASPRPARHSPAPSPPHARLARPSSPGPANRLSRIALGTSRRPPHS